MEPTGTVLLSFPAKHEYKCPKCGLSQYFEDEAQRASLNRSNFIKEDVSDCVISASNVLNESITP